MKILKTQVLRGPNYWSNYRKKLVVLKLDLEQYEELPTNRILGFADRLLMLLPSLKSHTCSIGEEGGLIQRMKEGTWLGHVIEHVALELQSLAGMDCGFGRTYGTGVYGVYDVIFSYLIEEAGVYAGHAAVQLVQSLAENKDYNLANALEQLQSVCRNHSMGPSTQAIVDEAVKRHIPYKRYNNTSLITLGHGKNQKKIWAAMTSKTSAIAMDIASDKGFTKHILDSHYIPTPKGVTVYCESELKQAIDQIGYPIVIKPLDGNHGKGVTTNINDYEKALFGFHLAKYNSEQIIVERYIKGEDYRILVVNYKVVAVAHRTPAMIIGDGCSTIEMLIDKANEDPNRGEAHENVLTTIKVDDVTHSILQRNKLNLSSVLADNQIVYLKETANLSSGGTATDVTERIHPHTVFLAERAARVLNLDICGIDVIAKDIKLPITDNMGAIIEVNAGPGLRMHLAPTSGKARNVAEPILKMLYPSSASASIPLVAVTGTNGKTTVVRLVAHLARFCGHHHTGYTTTEGIYINDTLLHAGDCSGPTSAETILLSPEVDYAILECARGGILRSGLGFDACDISIVTNITADHLGLNDIYTLEDLAQVKAVVPKSTKKDGYAILNADDNLTYGLHVDLDCNIALFGKFESPRIRKHCAKGGLAAYIHNHYLIVQRGLEQHVLVKINDVPLSLNGKATCMLLNILPAVLAGVISNFSMEKIKEALLSFYPTPENLPGRMNLFKLADCDVMIDYAHNEGAFCELKNYLDSIHASSKIGIIGVAGDRRDEDIEQVAFHAGGMFDEIIIRHDKDGRGRCNEEINALLNAGLIRSGYKAKIKIISDEFHAIEHVLSQVKNNSFIFCAVEDVFGMTSFLKGKVQNSHQMNEVLNDAQS